MYLNLFDQISRFKQNGDTPTDGRTDGRTDGLTDGQTDKEMDRQSPYTMDI